MTYVGATQFCIVFDKNLYAILGAVRSTKVSGSSLLPLGNKVSLSLDKARESRGKLKEGDSSYSRIEINLE